MTVAQLQRLRQVAPDTGRLPLPRTGEGEGTSFADTLKDAVGRVDGAQKEADNQIEAFVAGEQDNLHEVMISMNSARVTFQLMAEVRNKMLDTYQELMRMQV